jgi:nicotinate-nucleotide pyrophosphorylase (carboxylating)
MPKKLSGKHEMKAFLPQLPALLIEEAIRAALLEDLGRAGDITSNATIPPDANAVATLSTRENGVLCGIEFARTAFRLIDPNLSFDSRLEDGAALKKGDIIAVVSGPARALLSGERVALNFMMHLSGIASHTALFAAKIAHTKARVTCTRKTLPGLRAFEKYAVRIGGGSTHRYGLDDAILIKDNHIAVAGGVRQAMRAGKAFAGHLVKVECEVTSLEQLREALAEKPDVILLDNMSPELLEKAVKITGGQVILEASGGISFDTIKAVAETGVDYISTSKITMSAPTLDVGLDVEIG